MLSTKLRQVVPIELPDALDDRSIFSDDRTHSEVDRHRSPA
jgi:hypothetical protein